MSTYGSQGYKSQISEVRFSLLHKCLYTFLHTFGVIKRIEQFPLQGDTFGHGEILILFYGFLGSNESCDWSVGHLFGKFDHLGVQVGCRIYLADYTQFVGSFGWDEF